MNKTVAFPRCFGPLAIDPVTRKLHGPAGEAVVEPLVMRLLLLLVDASGEVVPRRELFAALWGNAQVGDDSLNRLVVRLRQALRSVIGNDLRIETVPRVGYQLKDESEGSTSSVTRRAMLGAGAATAAAALVGAGLWKHSAVDADSALRWVDEGDVRLRDAAPVQAGLAIPPLRRALAIDPDNPRALGLLALAEETQANNGGSRDPGASLRAAEQAAKSALGRSPDEPHARLALLDMSGTSLDWLAWENALERLRARHPANLHVLGSLSSFLQAAGQTSRSWAINEQEAAAAPSSPTPQWRRVLRLWTGGRDEEALLLSERLIRLWPHHPMVWNARFMTLAFTGRVAAAEALASRPNPVLNAHPIDHDQWRPTFTALAKPNLANLAAARAANLAAAQRNPGQAAYAAMVLSQLGELDSAFAVIDAVLLAQGPLVTPRSVAPGSFLVNSPSWCRTQWLFMPPLAAVRADRRFSPLCDAIGLTRYWDAHGGGPDTSVPEGVRFG